MSKPILFSGPMVRAILEGKKTQTRRIIPNPVVEDGKLTGWRDRFGNWNAPLRMPYGYVGEMLWVKETWAAPLGPGQVYYRADCERTHTDTGEKIHWRSGRFMKREYARLKLVIVAYRYEQLQAISEADCFSEGVPRWACHDPSEHALDRPLDDAIWCPKCNGAGVHGALGPNLGVTEVDCEECNTPQKLFRNLWDATNGNRAPWASNPWVWPITFRRLN